MSRLQLSEWSLRALLILLVVDVFIVAPIAQGERLPALQPAVHSIVLLSGIAIASRSRAPTMTVVGMLAVMRAVDRKVGLPERSRESVRQYGVVFDNQDAHRVPNECVTLSSTKDEVERLYTEKPSFLAAP